MALSSQDLVPSNKMIKKLFLKLIEPDLPFRGDVVGALIALLLIYLFGD